MSLPLSHPESNTPPAGNSRLSLYAPLLLLALTLLAYAPVFRADFTRWDDPLWIGTNPALAPTPTLSGLATQWAGGPDAKGVFLHLYSPLTHTAWYLIALFARTDNIVSDCLRLPLDPAIFHIANVAAHLATTLLLYRLLKTLLSSTATWPALFGAALFALHPINVEAVAWISDLKDVLCTLCITAALLATTRSARQIVAGKKSMWLWAFFFTFLAALGKPTAIVIPPIAAVLLLAIYRIPPRRLLWPGVASILFMATLAYLTARWQPAITLPDPAPLAMRPLVATATLGHYLAHLALPTNFAIDYGLSPGYLARNLHWLPYTLLFLLLATLAALSRDRLIIAGVALFILALGPVLGLKNFDFAAASVVADHYAYPAMIGAALVLARLAQRLSATRFRKPAACAAAAFTLALIPLTCRQAANWHDSKTLFESSLRVNPSALTTNSNYAELLASQHDYAGSLDHALKAIAIYPNYPQANKLAADAYAALSQPDLALKHYVAAGPSYAALSDYQAQVGNVFAELNKLDKAVTHYRQALRIDPKNPTALRMLPLVLAEIQKQATTHPTTTHPTTRPVP